MLELRRLVEAALGSRVGLPSFDGIRVLLRSLSIPLRLMDESPATNGASLTFERGFGVLEL